ncbi:MAG: CDP-alcohol phosphatidyltransferase family protein [Byssovorax sp.]
MIRAADLLRAPNLLSLARIPLGALFPFVSRSVPASLAVLAAAGLTDVLDGWLARRTHTETALGAIIDPVADKVFALTVVVTLAADGRLPWWGIPALLGREILEAPLIAYVLIRRHREREPVGETRANLPGKVATVAQVVTVILAIAAPSLLGAALVVTAIAATAAGVLYWVRELKRPQAARVV